MQIGLFIPCYIDAFFPQVGIATLELLERSAVLAHDLRDNKHPPYHRLVWSIAPLNWDPETRSRIIDYCPACRAELLWSNARDVRTCASCGCDLCTVVSDAASPCAHDEVLMQLFHPDPAMRHAHRSTLAECVRSFGEGDLIDLLEVLSDVSCLVRTGAAKNPMAIDRSRAVSVLSTGEEALFDLLGSAIVDKDNGKERLAGMRRLGTLYARIGELPSKPARDLIVRVLHRVA
jgi:hypothetical protein